MLKDIYYSPCDFSESMEALPLDSKATLKDTHFNLIAPKGSILPNPFHVFLLKSHTHSIIS